jgi:transcriptional repressor
MQEIKDRIAEALKLKGKTPKQLSDLTGIPISSISQYMSGHVKPKQDRIYLICKALRINEAWLLGFDDVPMDLDIKRINKTTIDLTDEEIDIIKGYRLSSEDGKKTIQYVITKEREIREYQNESRQFRKENS